MLQGGVLDRQPTSIQCRTARHPLSSHSNASGSGRPGARRWRTCCQAGGRGGHRDWHGRRRRHPPRGRPAARQPGRDDRSGSRPAPSSRASTSLRHWAANSQRCNVGGESAGLGGEGCTERGRSHLPRSGGCWRPVAGPCDGRRRRAAAGGCTRHRSAAAGCALPALHLCCHERSGCRHTGACMTAAVSASLPHAPSNGGQEGPSAALTVCCYVNSGALQSALQRAGSLASAGGAAVLHGDIVPAKDSAEQDEAVPEAEPGHTAGTAVAHLIPLNSSKWWRHP